jgi:beta-glucosidase
MQDDIRPPGPAVSRREVLAAGVALASLPLTGFSQSSNQRAAFPDGFLWGAATAGHQVEGNNVASDLWFLENLEPSPFAEPSGDGCNSFELWRTDLDLVQSLGLNSYRFSLEWARIEPEPGLVSMAMLDHYKAIIQGCLERGLAPLVTYNHFTTPRWFAARGGWLDDDAPQRFADFCERATRHLGQDIRYAMTLNEPNLMLLLRSMGLPPQMWQGNAAALAAAAHALRVDRFVSANVTGFDEIGALVTGMLAGHKAGRAAIKSVRPDLPVGLTLAVVDDQAAGRSSLRDARRKEIYGACLAAADGDDFIGVQNYSRTVWDDKGPVPAPPDAVRNHMGAEVYAPSLAGAVRYVYEASGLPILVTEHGVGTEDDGVRARLIPAALQELRQAMDDGVPVHAYVHWSLMDNFEWVFGYGPKFGLVAVDRKTFERTPKPSALVLGSIARANRVPVDG